MRQDNLYKGIEDWLVQKEDYEIPDLKTMKQRLDNMFESTDKKYSWVMEMMHDTIKGFEGDIIISKERKGSLLFYMYSHNYSPSITHKKYSLIKKEDLRGKSVLVFDDGIHYGSTMRGIINKLKNFPPAQIKVYAFITDVESFNKLRNDYPDVNFESTLKVPPEDYTITYNRNFYRMFDKLERPLDSHLEYDVFVRGINRLSDITNLFTIPNMDCYHIPTLESKDLQVLKGTLSSIDLGLVKCPAINIPYRLEMYKIRFYVYKEERGKIRFTFTPIIQMSGYDIEKCKGNSPYCAKFKNVVEGTNGNAVPIGCLSCGEFQITIPLFKSFIKEFISRLHSKKIEVVKENYRWDLIEKFGIKIPENYFSSASSSL